MGPLGLLSVYDRKQANTYTDRKRYLNRRKIGRKAVLCVTTALLAVMLLTVGLRSETMHNSEMGLRDDTLEPFSRKLVSAAGCENTEVKPAQLGLQLAGLIYFFLGLAVVCDEYFQMALEVISLNLKLSPDVAGATFLAAGSSAPELFTALSDTFSTNNSIGTGTVVGSAMFNILVIVALAAIIAGKGGVWLNVDWRPICRDVSFYAVSIILLVIVFLNYSVSLLESCITVGTYILYVVFMKYNADILGRCKSTRVDDISSDRDAIDAAEMALRSSQKLSLSSSSLHSPRRASLQTLGVRYRQGSFGSDHPPTLRRASPPGGSSYILQRKPSQTLGIRHRAEKNQWRSAITKVIAVQKFAALRQWESGSNESLHKSLYSSTTKPKLVREDGDVELSQMPSGVEKEPSHFKIQEGPGSDEFDGREVGPEEETEEEQGRFEWPDSNFDRFIYIFSFPFLVAFLLTIPDCGRDVETYNCCGRSFTIDWSKWFVATFIVSIFWIAGLTYFMVQWATSIGCQLNIDPIIMGVVFLAAGTSIPDAIGSMIAARNGEADMAIANALGSNVFDILLGLGLPWLLSNIYYGKRAEVSGDGLVENVIILAGTVVLFIFVLAVNKWRINTTVGIVLFVLYFVFIVYAILKSVL